MNWSELILSRIWSCPGMTSKSIPGGEQVIPSFRQVMNKITQGNEGTKCTDKPSVFGMVGLSVLCYLVTLIHDLEPKFGFMGFRRCL